MAGNRSPWRALQPVFLAGAAALTWLTFSASTASADALPDTTSLLGGVTASVSSVTEMLPVPAAAAPAPVYSPGLLQPLGGNVSGLADQVVSSVTVEADLDPSGTVSAITVPVAQVADAATAEAVGSPVPGALPVLEPVLQPVADPATVTEPPPVELPEPPVAAVDGNAPAGAGTVPAGQAVTPVVSAPAADTPAATSAVPFIEATGVPTTAAPVGWAALAAPSVTPRASITWPGSAQEQPTADPPPAPAQGPAAPAFGTGSGAAPAVSSGSAAWLSPFNLDLPLSGAVRAEETSENAPDPVSFDPGSSPD